MKRIIQGYQSGGYVQRYNEGDSVSAAGFGTNTGLPEGGNASSAITSYLKGPLGIDISYDPNAKQQGDIFNELAAKRRALAASLGGTAMSASNQQQVLDDSDKTFASAKASGGSLGNYTTYGGHKDVAHATIDKAFADYGKSISDGTAKKEDNPGFNQEVADANKNKIATWTNSNGDSVSKTYSQLTSDDFKGVSTADQYRLMANSMQGNGISDIGGGYNQSDSTSTLKDIYGNVTSSLNNAMQGKGIFSYLPTAQLVKKIAPPISTYDPVPVTTPVRTYTPPSVTLSSVTPPNLYSSVPAVSQPRRTSTDRANDQAQQAHHERKHADRENAYSKKTGMTHGYTVGNTGGEVYQNTIGNNPMYKGPLSLNMGGVSIANSQKVDEEQQMVAPLRAPQITQQPQGSLGMLGDLVKGKVINKGADMAVDGVKKAALKMGVSQIPGVGPFLAMLL